MAGPSLPRAVVLAAGNPLRRDDGAGPAVVRRLAGRLPDGVTAEAVDGGAAEILDALAGAARAVLVDATSSGAPPGTVHRLDASAAPLPASFSRASSHGLGLAEAVELGRALGQLPPHLVVYGIEGADFGPGEGLTPAVAAAVEAVAEQVLRELGAAQPPCGDPARDPAGRGSPAQGSASAARQAGQKRGGLRSISST